MRRVLLFFPLEIGSSMLIIGSFKVAFSLIQPGLLEYWGISKEDRLLLCLLNIRIQL